MAVARLSPRDFGDTPVIHTAQLLAHAISALLRSLEHRGLLFLPLMLAAKASATSVPFVCRPKSARDVEAIASSVRAS